MDFTYAFRLDEMTADAVRSRKPEEDIDAIYFAVFIDNEKVYEQAGLIPGHVQNGQHFSFVTDSSAEYEADFLTVAKDSVVWVLCIIDNQPFENDAERLSHILKAAGAVATLLGGTWSSLTRSSTKPN